MTERRFFNERENVRIQGLMLNSASLAPKKSGWVRLTEEYPSNIETNSKRTEAQLKKCRKNLLTRRKSVRVREKREGRTGGGPDNPHSSSTSSQYQIMEVTCSDADDTSTEEMAEVEEKLTVLDSSVLADTSQVSAASESSTQVVKDYAIETDPTITPPHQPEFRPIDFCIAPLQAASAATQAQIDALINFMSENKELARGQLRNTDGRMRSKRLWEGLCNALNSMGSCIKSVEQWQRVWADKKHLAKKAAAASRRSACSGGPTALSQMELRILSIMGEGNGERQTDARLPNFPSGPPVRQDSAAMSPPHTSATTSADPLSQVQSSVSPDPLELEFPTLNEEIPRHMRNGTQEDFCVRRRTFDRYHKKEEKLHKLRLAEKEWLVKAAEENFYKAKAEREAAEELVLCNRAKRKEAELRLAILRTQNY